MAGCNSLVPYVEIKTFDSSLSREQKNYFLYLNEDTISKRDIVLIVKYDDSYDKERLNLQFELLSPHNELYKDTLSVALFSNKMGKAIGKKGVSMYDLESDIIKDGVFKGIGVYKMSLLPITNIDGVMAIGIAVK